MSTLDFIPKLAAKKEYLKSQKQIKEEQIKNLEEEIKAVDKRNTDLKKDIDKMMDKRRNYKDKQSQAIEERQRLSLSNEVLRKNWTDAKEETKKAEQRIEMREIECSKIIRRYKEEWLSFRESLSKKSEVLELNKIQLNMDKIRNEIKESDKRIDERKKQLNNMAKKEEDAVIPKTLDLVKFIQYTQVKKNIEGYQNKIAELQEGILIRCNGSSRKHFIQNKCKIIPKTRIEDLNIFGISSLSPPPVKITGRQNGLEKINECVRKNKQNRLDFN